MPKQWTVRDYAAVIGVSLALAIAVAGASATFVSSRVSTHNAKPSHDGMDKRAGEIEQAVEDVEDAIVAVATEVAKQTASIRAIGDRQKEMITERRSSVAHQTEILERVERKLNNP